MCKITSPSYTILFSFLSILSAFASDDVNIKSEQAELFLMRRLAKEFPAGAVVDAKGAIYFSTLDTMIKSHISCRFSFDPKRLWHPESETIVKNFFNAGGVFIPFQDSTQNIISKRAIGEIAELISYPFFIASKRFKGYNFTVRKKFTEINGIRCIKISVKPNSDDNLEESPMTGNIYIADDEVHRIVRFEHRIRRSGVEQLIWWDFKNLGEFDFPYKITASLATEMCGINYETMIKTYFADLQLMMPFDNSKPVPRRETTTQTK